MTIAATATTSFHICAPFRAEKNVIVLKLESEEFAPIGWAGIYKLGLISVSIFKVFAHSC